MKITYLGRDVSGRFSSFKSFCKRAVRFTVRWSLISAAAYIVFMSGAMLYSTSTVIASEPVTIIAPVVFPPALEHICNAESGGKQFLDNGRVVRGKVNPSDIGICQINEPIWNDKARELGYDIYTEQGNRDMALWIFNHYGADPWNSSRGAWSKKLGDN